MTTALLESPTRRCPGPAEVARVDPRPVEVHTGPTPDIGPDAPRRNPVRMWLAGALLALGVGVLALRLHPGELVAAVTHAHGGYVLAAIGWMALSIVAAAYNISAFSTVRLRARDGILGQLAVSGLRVVTPSAVSTPLVVTRLLRRAGAPTSAALTTVAAAQLVQFIATFAVVAVLAAHSGAAGPALPSTPVLLVGIGAGLVVAAGLVAAATRVPRVRGWASQARHSVAGLAAHTRAHPWRATVGVGASAALTLTHVLAFAACVRAAGGHAPLLTLAAVYLGAATAGSLLPTPGGVGAVEAALIVGLTGCGVALPVATAATALSRLVSVWLPAVPGWLAVARLRRTGLL